MCVQLNYCLNLYIIKLNPVIERILDYIMPEPRGQNPSAWTGVHTDWYPLYFNAWSEIFPQNLWEVSSLCTINTAMVNVFLY